MPRFAAVDVGSNALRLRIIEASAPSHAPKAQLPLLPDTPMPSGPWRDLATLRAPVRLGAEVFLTGRLAPAFTMSLPLGTVRMLEAYLKGAKTIDRARERLLEEAIDRALGEALPKLGSVDLLVGTGGNVETLFDLCPAKGTQRAIDVSAARSLFKKMCAMSNGERRDTWQLRPDRADTIVPATAIFLRIAGALKRTTILAPGVGLAAGILEELVDKFFHVWDAAGEAEHIIEACMRIGRHYHFDEAHARCVCRFATQLFDDLRAVHVFHDRDRLLLRAAAVLHDIGDYVHYSGHHKHSYYLIQNADIMGVTPDERAIVANIARYHRKGPPDPTHPNFRELTKEARGKVRGLAAILRIVDALDREHKQKIESVRAAVDREAGRVTLFLSGGKDRELEEWTVGAKASLWRDEYDLDVVIAKAEVGA
jgi:exopolyphosphatase/guanosine-5'-triphosphate,3'-diphosphate pyrophosphatase